MNKVPFPELSGFGEDKAFQLNNSHNLNMPWFLLLIWI